MESYNWQTQLSTVRERTEYAYKNSLFCDVKFTVFDSVDGEKVTIPASKYMLAISSPVFEAMFYGDLTEKQDTIDLPDCTKEGLQELLHFVHSDEVNLTRNNVIEVLYMADKYIMPFLAVKCREYLQESLKPEEVFSVLPQVQKISDKELEKHCWNIIDNETQLAMSSKPFLEISREMLCQVLSRDSLIIKELEIFQAVDKWVASKIDEEGLENTGESKRAILGEEVIRLIRFPLMSQKDVAEVVLSTRMFCEKTRRGSKREVWSKSRFSNIYHTSTWKYGNDKVDAIDFTVSKAVSLIGVEVLGTQGSAYNIKLEILQSNKILSSMSSSCVSKLVDDRYYAFDVKLDAPVCLTPKVSYTVKAIINGPKSNYGQSGESVVNINNDVKITFKKSNKSTNGTCINSGQFPSLKFLLYDYK